MNNYHQINDTAEFSSDLFDMLDAEEGYAPRVYADSLGIPSIGIRLNLTIAANIGYTADALGVYDSADPADSGSTDFFIIFQLLTKILPLKIQS